MTVCLPRIRRIVPLLGLLVILMGVLCSSAQAATTLTLDPTAGELPEGLAFDHHGDAFFTAAPLGEVRELTPGGTQTVIAHVAPPGVGFGTTGLAFSRDGRLFVAVTTFDPATSGVYEVHPDGTSTRVPGSEQIVFPNGLAFGQDGTLYVTDSGRGAVWQLDVGHRSHAGGSTTLLVEDPVLAGDGSFGFGVPIGANGIALRDGALYVSVTETARIVRIPLLKNGGPGAPQIVAEGPAVLGADGIQFDVHGNLYIALNPQNMIARLSPGGALTTIATAADGLDAPASPAFGTGPRGRKTLYVTNFAIGHANPADAHPGILAFDVGGPGAPLPAPGPFSS